jgi:N-methylhydantoinase A
MPLEVDAAEHAMSKVAAALDTSVADTSGGVHEVVNQNMAASARMHAIERGADLRGTPVIAFGGAGPVHACGVAELLESPTVVFPANASVLSAFGALVTPMRIDLARSLVRRLDQISAGERDAVLDDMRREGSSVLAAAGVPPDAVVFRYAIDARYHGQGNEITVALGDGPVWPVAEDEIMARFAERYAAVYGLTIPDVPVEIVTWRVSAFAPPPAVTLVPRAVGAGRPEPKGTRPVRFARGTAPLPTPVYARGELGVGTTVDGPALIEERETTAVLRPGWHAEVNSDGSLIATRRARTE